MLPVNDLRKGDAIILDGETYLVMDAHFHRAQQRKANVRTKLKNIDIKINKPNIINII